MNKITKTQTGTWIVGGIEYNEHPPCGKLFKVMERQWAEKLKNEGSIRFGNLREYRCWENKTLGDKHDGKGMYTMGSHEYNTGSVNEVFAWCSSLQSVSDKRILELATAGNYNCVVKINEPITFFNRIAKTIFAPNYTKKLYFHCGRIVYNRGQKVNKEKLSSHKFHFNVFQKNKKFSKDCEYRLSLTDLTSNIKNCHIITIGCCTDIIEINDLPPN